MRVFTIKINSIVLVSFKASKVVLIERLEYSINLGYILLKVRVNSIIIS
jgi:hypothetical protein